MLYPRTHKPRGALLGVGALLLAGVIVPARADYASTVLDKDPVVYWRLGETATPPAADVAKNLGSVGTAGDGFYLGNVYRPIFGALVGSTDGASDFDGQSGTFVNIPPVPELNPADAFTVEFWVSPYVALEGTTLTSPLASLRRVVPDASGWIFYQSATAWNFRMGNTTENYKVNINSTAAPDLSGWSHLVATFDGTTARLYVNGVQQASAVFDGTYTPNTIVPMGIGGRGDNAFLFNGGVDEVAIYGQALSGAVVLSHYQNGTSLSPSKDYDDLVAESSPLGYWRLGEDPYTPPTTLPTANNSGSLGDAGDASYQPGVMPGVEGPQPPAFAGFDAGNRGCGFNGVVGHVSTSLQNLFNQSTYTMIGWFRPDGAQPNRTGLCGQNDTLEYGWHDAATTFGPWSAVGGFPSINPSLITEGEWHFFATVGDGTAHKLILDGVEVASVAASPAAYGTSGYNFNIGGGGILDAAGNFFRGAIDEVAVFNKALTSAELNEIYYSAGIAPYITEQPEPPGREIYAGHTVVLSVRASGSPELLYQWRKDGAEIDGATSPDLVLAGIMVDDAGDYDVVVSNASGTVTSATVTLTVRDDDTTAPTLQYAAGDLSLMGVRVWFSEPLDPASAQNPANYAISGGVTVTSATLAAPAGYEGDHIVDLVTTAQTQGEVYTLTVNHVKDQVTPGNTIAANSIIEFSAWALLPGYLTFEHYDNITGATDADIDLGLQDPRVIAGTPTTSGFLVGEFNTRTIFPDDSHENYLARMYGWITPTETADYYFFLRSDDAARLYLSPNEDIPDPATDTPIAQETDCCDNFVEPWTPNDDNLTYPTTPEPISLVAGRSYGVLALLKEAGGGDYLMVAWRKASDDTPAAELPYLPGTFFSSYVDPNVDLAFPVQPTDQVATLPSAGDLIIAEDFEANDGGFTVENTTSPAPPGPWIYDGAAGQWVAEGSTDACDGPYNSKLTSPAWVLAEDVSVTVVFSHRYSFEGDLWDAGQVYYQVNGGDWTLVPADNFSQNGYAKGEIIGNGIALGSRGFNGDSPGYANGDFITSKAFLGVFSMDDEVRVQFVGAWDDCSTGTNPNWVIDSVGLEALPALTVDFSQGDGGYTVDNSGPPPANWGPWEYDASEGKWAASGSDTECGGPWNSNLTGPEYVVAQSDEVTLNFTHRFRIEDEYDGGQIRISVNGGAFTPVSPDNFIANGYTPGAVIGNGILNGQRAFHGTSAGFDAGEFITSSVILGEFSQGETIAVQFVGGWDDCWSPGQPGWEIKSLNLVFGKAARAVRFEAQATASRQGNPMSFSYQWQRDDGQGWTDIPLATDPSYRFFPTLADFDALFRVEARVPGKSLASNVVRLVESVVGEPSVAISIADGQIIIDYTGTLQHSETVTGPYEDVAGAQSPYTVPAGGTTGFYRSTE